MVQIRDAQPSDGLPDSQWGYNDIALTFTRDGLGNPTPDRAVEHDVIYNADQDPNSGFSQELIDASHNPLPPQGIIEQRIPFQLTPEDQLIRYTIPNSSDSFVVVRRPIYTDRCIGSDLGNSNNIFNMSPNLANALAHLTARDSASQWCADRRPYRDPGHGTLRMVTPFNLEGETAHTSVRELRSAIDRLDSIRAHPEMEHNPLVRSLALSLGDHDTRKLNDQINDRLGWLGRAHYFIDTEPVLSTIAGLATFAAGAAGFSYIGVLVHPIAERHLEAITRFPGLVALAIPSLRAIPYIASVTGHAVASTILGSAGAFAATASVAGAALGYGIHASGLGRHIGTDWLGHQIGDSLGSAAPRLGLWLARTFDL